MKFLTIAATFLLALMATGNATASDRVDHFKGLPADTLEEAVRNFSEYNERLAAIVAQEELSAADMATVHELTYTLENALERINQEFAALADSLEEVHVASETDDREDTQAKGQAYLETARTVIP